MNTIISVKQIARDTLPRLLDNLVFPNLIYRDGGETLAAKQGESVLVRKPVKLEAASFDKEAGVQVQDMAESSVEVKLDTLATVDAALGAWENYNEDTIRRLFIEPAAAALAEKINADGLQLYKGVYQTAGVPGETPDGLDDLAAASYGMDVAKIPTDSRRAVWAPLVTSKLKQIPALVNADKCGDTNALRTGSIGQVFGISHFMSQAVCQHTAGTLSSSTAGLTVKSDVTNGVAVRILADASIEGMQLAVGDLIEVNGKTHTVTNAATGYGTDMLVQITPAITAAAGDKVTVIPSHTANLLFHPHAFAFVTRPLASPAGVESYVTTYNGVSLRVTRGYDMQYKKEMLSMDVLYGFKTIYPELAVRYMS